MKKTLVIGASLKPERYSNMAMQRLQQNGHPVEALGLSEGTVNGIPIKIGKPRVEQIDTVTLYINPKLQKNYYDYIIELKPKRIIFNPGTENPELEKMATQVGIDCQIACTLVLLSTNQY